MKNTERVPVRQPDRVLSYFENQRSVLAVVTVSGLIYNLGLVVGPWFEGQLAQCLLGILNGNETFAAMAALCAGYLIAIAVVQGSRFIKRLYVRKFANNINRSMKQVLYANLVRKDKVELEQAGTGTLMTKAISDVDACAEGMRKFTTEIFDTGIALLAYAVMLLGYDWRLALLCLVFAPISYYIAEQMKNLVQRTGAANKESTGRLSAATLDRVSGALTYRVYGCEPQRDAAYEACLQDYERTAVKAGLPVAAMPPLYGVISMTGVLFIFTFGARNVAGTGWAAWDIAAFTTSLSCFGKLAVKAVQRGAESPGILGTHQTADAPAGPPAGRDPGQAGNPDREQAGLFLPGRGTGFAGYHLYRAAGPDFWHYRRGGLRQIHTGQSVFV